MNSSTGRSAESEKRTGFEQDLDHLRQVRLFQGLDLEHLKLIAMLSRKVDLIEGDQLMVQGEDDGNAYYLITGKLQGFHRKSGIDYPMLVVEPGEFIGGLALLGTAIRLFTVQATETSSLLRLPRDSFQKAMQQFTGNMAKIAANMASEVADWEKNVLIQIEEKELEVGNQSLGISLL